MVRDLIPVSQVFYLSLWSIWIWSLVVIVCGCWTVEQVWLLVGCLVVDHLNGIYTGAVTQPSLSCSLLKYLFCFIVYLLWIPLIWLTSHQQILPWCGTYTLISCQRPTPRHHLLLHHLSQLTQSLHHLRLHCYSLLAVFTSSHATSLQSAHMNSTPSQVMPLQPDQMILTWSLPSQLIFPPSQPTSSGVRSSSAIQPITVPYSTLSQALPISEDNCHASVQAMQPFLGFNDLAINMTGHANQCHLESAVIHLPQQPCLVLALARRDVKGQWFTCPLCLVDCLLKTVNIRAPTV